MERPLKLGLTLAVVLAFPWLAVSVAANLVTIALPKSTSSSGLCSLNPGACPVSQAQNLQPLGQPGEYTIVLYLAALAILFVAVSYYAWKRGLKTKKDSFWNLPFLILGFVALFVVIAAMNAIRSGFFPAYHAGSSVELPLSYILLSAIIVASITSVFWAVQRSPKPLPSVSPTHEDERKEAAGILHRAVRSLRLGSNPRSVIISCYRSLTEVVQAVGAQNGPAMTAREFEVSARELLSVPREPVHRLTALFEKARYSDDDIDAVEASDAEDTLSELRQALEGVPTN